VIYGIGAGSFREGAARRESSARGGDTRGSSSGIGPFGAAIQPIGCVARDGEVPSRKNYLMCGGGNA
jgi:hypothetical protein